MVSKALVIQTDADPGSAYATGETVNTCCELLWRFHDLLRTRRTCSPPSADQLQALSIHCVLFKGDATQDAPALGLLCVSGLPEPDDGSFKPSMFGNGTSGQLAVLFLITVHSGNPNS